jgi:hypothetical protein
VDGLARNHSIGSVRAVLKRSFYGVYHALSVRHLNHYIAEFEFWLNKGKLQGARV